MKAEKVIQAARNNAIWCDGVCRAHGIPGEFHETVWLNRHSVPCFYSNAVTLRGQDAENSQISHIQTLLASDLPGNWSVKDSFCTLNLADLGFGILFEATWLRRDPGPTLKSDPEIEWGEVGSPAELAAWEQAWSGDAANATNKAQPRIFLPALLGDRDISFLAAYRGERIIAVAIANRTGEVVGLSNVFALEEAGREIWAGCVEAVQVRYPELPIVGYERGDDLENALAVGFEPLGDLRVWIRHRE